MASKPGYGPRMSARDALIRSCLLAAHGNERVAMELYRRRTGRVLRTHGLRMALVRHPEWEAEILLQLRSELRHLALVSLKKNLIAGKERTVLATLAAVAKDLGFGVAVEGGGGDGRSGGGVMREVLSSMRPEDLAALRDLVARAAAAVGGGGPLLEGRVEGGGGDGGERREGA